MTADTIRTDQEAFCNDPEPLYATRYQWTIPRGDKGIDDGPAAGGRSLPGNVPGVGNVVVGVP